MKYLIIGNGRMAKHSSHYFNLLLIEHLKWDRSQPIEDLEAKSKIADRVLVLISDSAIDKFIEENQFLRDCYLVHFSGSLNSKYAHACHPLMSFVKDRLYDVAAYKSMSFVTDLDGRKFSEMFPNLPNSSYAVEKEQRPLYHALCVMAGNFSAILWGKLFKDFEEKLNLPQKIAFPYMRQVFDNLEKNPINALTGPLVRKDYETVAANLKALEDDDFKEIYLAFAKKYDCV